MEWSSLQTWGIGLIETLGPYLLARCYIRDADDFYNLIRLQFRIVLLLLPFAIVEFITGHDIWRDLFAAICASKIESADATARGANSGANGF